VSPRVSLLPAEEVLFSTDYGRCWQHVPLAEALLVDNIRCVLWVGAPWLALVSLHTPTTRRPIAQACINSFTQCILLLPTCVTDNTTQCAACIRQDRARWPAPPCCPSWPPLPPVPVPAVWVLGGRPQDRGGGGHHVPGGCPGDWWAQRKGEWVAWWICKATTTTFKLAASKAHPYFMDVVCVGRWRRDLLHASGGHQGPSAHVSAHLTRVAHLLQLQTVLR
jgi:hypothetical protein